MRLNNFNKIVLSIFLFIPIVGFAAIYPMPKPGNDIVGQVYTVKAQAGETIGSLGLRYGMSLHEMIEANPAIKEGKRLHAGQPVVIPAQFILPTIRQGIVIDLAELRLYFFTPDGNYVMTYPVAMGRDQWRTPTIETKVVSKETNPIWRVPDSIRDWTFENSGKLLPEEVLPGPDNPLGPYALHLGASGYLIHGNNSPTSIGKYVSSGCIRMRNPDIQTLFDQVKVGTPVYIVHYPTKVGWHNGVLYQKTQLPVELEEGESNLNITSLETAIERGLNGKTATINWDAVRAVARAHNGIPEPIGRSDMAQVNNNNEAPPSPIAMATEKDYVVDDGLQDLTSWLDPSLAGR